MSGTFTRIRKKGVFSPVMAEMIVVILFFALSMSVLIRLVVAADALSGESARESAAMLAMEQVMEECRFDPTAFGTFDENGVCKFSRKVDETNVDAAITRAPQDAGGVLYRIELIVSAPDDKTYSLDGARYVPLAGEAGA